jgi:hypothetical protein
LRIPETEFLRYLAECFICIYQPLFSYLETLELKIFFVRFPRFIFQQIIEICGRKTKYSDALLNSGKIGGLTLYSIEMIIQKTIKESVRELNICGGAEQSGTNPLAEDIPDQMMDFLSQMENM